MKSRKGGWSWGPVEGAKLRVLSMGAGIQSTALALMACKGVVGPLPDVMIFADPGAESGRTMEHLDWLEKEVARLTNGRMATKRVTAGSLTEMIENQSVGGGKFISAPFFNAKSGMGRRQCTREFKTAPLKKEQRALLGYKPRQRIPPGSCEVWIGISTEEVVRAGAAFDRWMVNRFPLLEMRFSRHDCERWLEKNGYPIPPKSACVFCPFRSDAAWRELRDTDPEAWNEAVRVDKLIRNSTTLDEGSFVHRSRKPLDEVDLSTAEERGQGWLLECEGGCGV